MSELAALLGGILLLAGSFLCLTGALGLLRFPDFYSRLHAAAITDTLGSGLLLAGLMLVAGWAPLVLAKLLLVFLFIMITSPTACHAMAAAARHSGLKVWLGRQRHD